MTSFTERLLSGLAEKGPLCVGLDPYPHKVPGLFGSGLAALAAFGSAVIESASGRAAFLKPQIALFERWGPDGLSILRDLTFLARDHGLMVLLDAKRGDIGATAAGYAEAYLGENAWLHTDAVTVNPYMGLDTLEPWLAPVRAGRKGLIVLVRTSNPGAKDFQAIEAAGTPLWMDVAKQLADLSRPLAEASGWSPLMMVVGATAPEEARAIRRVAPHCPFLVPGYGAQGAGAQDALAGQREGAGVIVNSSRSVLYPHAAETATSLSDWRSVIESAIMSAADDLRGVQHAS